MSALRGRSHKSSLLVMCEVISIYKFNQGSIFRENIEPRSHILPSVILDLLNHKCLVTFAPMLIILLRLQTNQMQQKLEFRYFPLFLYTCHSMFPRSAASFDADPPIILGIVEMFQICCHAQNCSILLMY